MAKTGLWLRGAKGKFAGAVLARGQNGATIQRELKAPSNPQTDAQATQRMKMAALCNFWRGLSGILDHSFEGIKYGNPSRMHFMSLGLSNPLSVAAVTKNEKGFASLPLVISQGSLYHAITVKGVPENPNRLALFGARPFTGWGDNRAEQIAELKAFAGVDDGQLTFVICRHVIENIDDSGEKVEVKRVILNPTNGIQDDLGYITTYFEPNENGMFEDDDTTALAVIYSKEVNGKWLRSTEKLTLADNIETARYETEAVVTAKKSYMKKSSSTVSDKYLNEGDQIIGNITRILVNGTAYPVGATVDIPAASSNDLKVDIEFADSNVFDPFKVESDAGGIMGETQLVGKKMSFIYNVARGKAAQLFYGEGDDDLILFINHANA